MTETFFVYGIYNKDRDKIYIGHTANLDERMRRHNGLLPNKRKSYTSRNSGAWSLIHIEKYHSRGAAIERERKLKRRQGRKFIRSLIRSG